MQEHPTSFGEGRYRVERLIGQGGMARVYLAYDTRNHRPVAIKVPNPNLLTPDKVVHVRARHDNERAVLGILVHPFVPALYDHGEEPSGKENNPTTTPYIVMEYVPGRDLEECRTEFGALPPRVVCHAMLQVLSVLAQLHADVRGIVHRDVKPANIRLRADKLVKLMDYGIAKVHRTRGSAGKTMFQPNMTRSDSPIGTRGFMGIAQISMDADLGPRADLYGVVATMVALLTGKDRAPDLWNVKGEVHTALTGVPRILRPIIIRCASEVIPDNQKVTSAEECARLLEALIAKLPEDDSDRFWKWFRKEGMTIVPDVLVPSSWPGGDIDEHLRELPSVDRFVPEPAEAEGEPAEFDDEGSAPDDEEFVPARRSRVLPFFGGAALLAALFGLGVVFWGDEPSVVQESLMPAVAAPSSAAVIEIDRRDTQPSLTRIATSDPAPSPPPESVGGVPAINTPPTPAEQTDRPKIDRPVRDRVPATVTPAPVVTPPPPIPAQAPPAPVEEEEKGTVRVTGGVPVRLKKGGAIFSAPGSVKPGTYTVEAQFADTYTPQMEITVKPGETRTVSCDRDFTSCE